MQNANPPMKKIVFEVLVARMFTVLGHVFQDKFQSRLLIDFFSIWGGLGAPFWDLWVDFSALHFSITFSSKGFFSVGPELGAPGAHHRRGGNWEACGNIWKHLEASGKHLEEHLEASGWPGWLWEARGGLGRKMHHNHAVLLSKMARATVSCRRAQL